MSASHHGAKVWYDRVGIDGITGLSMEQWAVKSPQIYSERRVLVVIPSNQEGINSIGQDWAGKLFSSSSFELISSLCLGSTIIPKGLRKLVRLGITDTPNIQLSTRAWLIQERAMAIRGRRLYLDDKSDQRLASAAALLFATTLLVHGNVNTSTLTAFFGTTLDGLKKLLDDGWDFMADFAGSRTLGGSRTMSDQVFTHFCMWSPVHGAGCSEFDAKARPDQTDRIIQSAVFWSAPIFDERDRCLMAIGMRGVEGSGLMTSYPQSSLEDGFRIVGW